MGEATAPPKANPAASQAEWLRRNRKKAITVRLLDGTRLSGLLVDWDTYTVTIRVQGREETVLLNKHAIAYLCAARPTTRRKTDPPPISRAAWHR